ncbi:MAG: tetratricopeptide repeat protein [Opitutales bacterium]
MHGGWAQLLGGIQGAVKWVGSNRIYRFYFLHVCFLGSLAATDTAHVQALLHEAETYDRAGDFQAAYDRASEALSSLESKDGFDEAIRGEAYLRFGIAAWGLGDLETGFKNILSAYGIFDELENQGKAAHAASNLGGIFVETGQFDLGIEYYQEAIRRYRSDDSESDALANSLGDLALAWEIIGDWEKANIIEAQALEMRRNLDDIRGVIISLNNSANRSWRFGLDSEAAHSMFLEAHELSRELGSSLFIAGTQVALATTYALKGDYVHAETLFSEAQEIFEDAEVPTINAGFNGGYAIGLSRIGGLEHRAIEILEDTLETFEQYGRQDSRDDYLDTMIALKRRMGRSEEALALLDEKEAWLAERDLERRRQRSALLDTLFEVEQAERSRDRALIDRAEMSLQLKETEAFRNYTMIAILGVGLVAVLIYWRSVSLARVNRKIREQNETLRRLSDEKEAFVRMASHDLKSPLAAISNTIALTRRMLSKNIPAEDETLRKVEETARYSLDNVIAFLDKTSESEGQGARADLATVIDTLISAHRLEIESKALRILQEDIHGSVNISGSRLERITDNLFVNALKASPRGGTIKIVAAEKAGSVVLEIFDEGAGIEKFEKGSGVGLSVASRLLEDCGGSLGVDNRVDQTGARGWVSIPSDR